MPVHTDIIEAIKNPIRMTWSNIAADAAEFVTSNEEAMEMVIDANRLTMFGYKDADGIIRKMITDSGYPEVLSALSKQIRLY